MPFSDYAAKDRSQKILLAKVEAATRESSFSVYSGSVYSKPFTKSPVISAVEEEGVAYTEGASTSLSAGQYYYDVKNSVLYVHTIGSDDPNAHFIAVSFFLFFSSRPLSLPNDLDSGFDVSWCPILKADSQFGVALDNKDTNLGNAIEGSGSLTFINDLNYWRPIFDKYTFENRRAFVYQYSTEINASEARLIYKGLIQTKSYSDKQITLGLKDLFNAFRNEIPLSSLSDYSYTHRILGTTNARITESEQNRKQRFVYGRPNGVKLQNIDSALNFPVYDSSDVIETFEVTTGSTLVKAADIAQTLVEGTQLEFSNNLGRQYTIGNIDPLVSPDNITLTEAFEGSTSTSVTAVVSKPGTFWQRYQRYYLVAGHPLSEISTTVTTAFTARLFRVSNVTGLEVGDNITVDGTEGRNITMISPATKQIEVDRDYTFLPVPSMSVTRSPIRKLYFNGEPIDQNVHYTVDAATALIELDSSNDNHPEFFLAKVSRGKGLVDRVNNLAIDPNSDTVDLQSQIEIGDWISLDNNPTVWRQVQAIGETGTILFFEGPGIPPSIGVGFSIKRPAYDENPVISADLIGKTEDNTTTGAPLETGPVIVRDLLKNSGLEDDLLSSSFDDSSVLIDHTLGLVIPSALSSTRAQKLRDAVNQVNRSIFGSLFQNSDYLLEYSVLDPTRDGSDQKLNRNEIISFSIKSDSRSVVQRVDILYNNKEVDNDSLDNSNLVSPYTSDIGQYLVKTEKVKEVDTLLVSDYSASIFASRWVRILELGRTLVTINTKLQTTERSVNDKIDFTHPNMYERFGSRFNRKIGLVNSIKRSASNVTLTFDDLGNAFSKKSSVTENDANSFSSSSEDEIMLNGFITDNDGNVDLDSILTNLIW